MAALPTAAKLLLILSLVLLPIGLALFAIARDGIEQANGVLKARSDDQGRAASRAIESLVARNALALRIAANGALAEGGDLCARANRSVSIAPGVAQRFEIDSVDGEPLCVVGQVPPTSDLPLVAPGDIKLRIAADRTSLVFRVGVIGYPTIINKLILTFINAILPHDRAR